VEKLDIDTANIVVRYYGGVVVAVLVVYVCVRLPVFMCNEEGGGENTNVLAKKKNPWLQKKVARLGGGQERQGKGREEKNNEAKRTPQMISTDKSEKTSASFTEDNW
jgi:hypothetical protein